MSGAARRRSARVAAAVLGAAVLAAGQAAADDPSLAEMDAYAARLDAGDREALDALADAPALFVAPDGKPENPGTREAPLDLGTALSAQAAIDPGTVVWLAGGTYRGPFDKAATPCGTARAPIVYRALPHARATLTAAKDARTVLTVRGDYIWFMDLEITADPEVPDERGDAVKVAGGNGLKLINLIVHDTPNRSGIGGWQVGDDQEFCGCIVYRVGMGGGAFAHGTYTQNTKRYTVKRITDCLFFDNFGFGVHCYGSDPALANYRFTGVAAWGNGLPEGSEKPVVNFLVGGYKDQDNMIVRECFTYFPGQGRFKRGFDLGYVAKRNGEALVEDCAFVGGRPAAQLVNWERLTFRGNRLYSPHALVHLIVPEGAPPGGHAFERNVYYCAGRAQPFSTNADPYKWRSAESSVLLAPAEWRTRLGLDRDSELHGAPAETWIYLRPGKYDPDRAHLLVYNWTGETRVKADIRGFIGVDRRYEIRLAHDLWGEPVARRDSAGGVVELPMAGPYAPEFAAYVVQRK